MARILSDGRVQLSCSWCHTLVDAAAGQVFCPTCGHRADVARVDCTCTTCKRAPVMSRDWRVEQGINDFDIVEHREGRAPYRLAGYIERAEDADVIAAATAMLQALHEVAGDHVYLEYPGRIPMCSFCAADEGCEHEFECTMNVVLAAIDRAEGREPKECYVVGNGTAVQP